MGQTVIPPVDPNWMPVLHEPAPTGALPLAAPATAISFMDDVLPVLIPIGIAFVIAVILSKDPKKGSRSRGLGVIKPCRTKDMTQVRAKDLQKWCLWNASGQRILGRHRSRSGAARQERLIQMKKHGG